MGPGLVQEWALAFDCPLQKCMASGEPKLAKCSPLLSCASMQDSSTPLSVSSFRFSLVVSGVCVVAAAAVVLFPSARFLKR